MELKVDWSMNWSNQLLYSVCHIKDIFVVVPEEVLINDKHFSTNSKHMDSHFKFSLFYPNTKLCIYIVPVQALDKFFQHLVFKSYLNSAKPNGI